MINGLVTLKAHIENVVLSGYAVKGISPKQLRLERALQRKLDALYKKAMNEIAARVKASGVAAGRAVADKLSTLTPRACDLIFADSRRAFDWGQGDIISQLKDHRMSIAQEPLDMFTVQGMRDKVFEASKTTLDRMIGNVTQVLADTMQMGLSNQDASVMLRGEFADMRQFELNRIARTEIQGAQNAGAHMTIERSGVYEQWWTGEDDLVRDSHQDLHGQITKPNGVFSNGLKFPGDKGGPIEEWVNCRCRSIPFIMPFKMQPPIGAEYFYEKDLIPIMHN